MDGDREIPRKNTPVQNSEQWLLSGDAPNLGALHWDLLRYFLEVAEAGSFRAAASSLNIAVNSVRKRVDELEREVNCVLFVRKANGVELTSDGRAIYPIAYEIKEHIEQLGSIAVNKHSGSSGLVRVGATDGIGAFWLTQQIPNFLHKHPNIKLDMKCEMRIQDISRTDCNMTVQLEKPRDEDLIAKKLGTLHFMMYATQGYIDRYGPVKSREDLANHSMVHIVAEQVPANLLAEKVTNDPFFKFVKVVANTSTAQAFAVASGVTVGLLPTYSSSMHAPFIPMDIDFNFSRPIWLVYSKEMMKIRRVRAVADWLIESFNPKVYPWFRDEFIHPKDFDPVPIDNKQFLDENIQWRFQFKSFLDQAREKVEKHTPLDEAIHLLESRIEEQRFTAIHLEDLIANLRHTGNRTICEKIEYLRDRYYMSKRPE